MNRQLPHPPARPVDHDPQDGAPVYAVADRPRAVVLTAATVLLAGGVVLVVARLLPVLGAWVLPLVLAALTAAFVVVGRRCAADGRTWAARAWAGWAGATGALALSGIVNAVGLGGALVAVGLLAIAGNAAIALWFRSPVHAAVVQLLGLAWGALAHVFGAAPWATLVLAVAGLWWLRAVGPARTPTVTTTLALPIAVMLLVHPLTHVGAALDGADVVVLTAAVAAAVTLVAVGRRPSVTTVWRTVRATATVALVAQVVLGAVPAVSTALAPATPWPSVLTATATVLGCLAVAAARPARPGLVPVLLLAALQVVETIVAVALGPVAAGTVGLAGLLTLVVVALARPTAPSGPATRNAWLWGAVLALPVLWAVAVGAPALVLAAVLLLAGGTVAGLVTVGVAR